MKRESLARWLLDPQTMIGLSAILLSFCGLFIAIYEASLIRQAQRASVWPNVEIGISLTPERITLRIENTGVGPARIKAAAVMLDGQVRTAWEPLLLELGGETENLGFYQSLVSDRVLPGNGGSEILVAMNRSAAADAAGSRFHAAIDEDRLDVEICYCSVYDECWTTRLQQMVRRLQGVLASIEPAPVDDCAGAPESAI